MLTFFPAFRLRYSARSHFFFRAFLLFIVAALLASCGGSTVGTSTTVMVYMIGSDLESGRDKPEEGGAASANLLEMMRAQLPPGSHVVIETGGARQTSRAGSPVPDWTTVRRHVLENGSLTLAADLGTIDMAKPASLSDFISWAHDSYPADRYRLVLWDHGAGWRGYGSDQNSQNSFTVPSLTTALAVANAHSGIHFDLIGFDACLMATVEVADALAPYADYLLASEEVEPGSGWDWTTAVNGLNTDAVTFGRATVDAYIAKQADSSYAGLTTLSLIDLSKIAPIETALVTFAATLQSVTSTPSTWIALADARRLAPAFGTDTAKSYDEVDMARFADLSATNGVSVNAATQLAAAARAAVVYAQNGKYYSDATGLSVYFPTASRTSLSNAAAYYELRFQPAYSGFMFAYIRQLNAMTHTITVDTHTSTSTQLNATAVSDYGFASIDAVLVSNVGADGTLTVVGSVPLSAVGTADGADGRLQLQAPLTGAWLTLNGYPVILGELTQNGGEGADNGTLYGLPVDIDGVASALVAQADAAGNVHLIGTIYAPGENADMANRIMPLPDATQEVRTLAATYSPTTQTFGDLTPSSPGFAGGNLTIAATALPSGSYSEAILVANLRQQLQMSSVVARP